MNIKQRQLIAVAAIVILAIAAAVIVIALSGDDGSSVEIDYGAITQSRTEDGAFVLGDPDAPVTIVEFADFLCPHCQDYKSTVEQFISEHVVTGQARFEYRMLPTQTGSVFLAQLAECAGEQRENGFWLAHDTLFELARKGDIDSDIGRTLANRLDLNYAELLECAENADQVVIDQRVAEREKVGGTPAIRVRYGDSAMQVLSEAPRGGAPIQVLKAVVSDANQQ